MKKKIKADRAARAAGRTAAIKTTAKVNVPLAPPSGMRDVLEPESIQRMELARTLLGDYRKHGYQLVRTSPCEYAELIDQTLSDEHKHNELRFIDPQTARVALLRPDMTLQVARIVASRLRDKPAPWRLCYEGSVIRQRGGNARTQRDISQIGIECIGLSPEHADAETIELVSRSCERVGLQNYYLELGHTGLGRRLLAALPPTFHARVASALTQKDTQTLSTLLGQARAKPALTHMFMKLVELYGDLNVFNRIPREFKTKEYVGFFAQLERILEQLANKHLIQHVRVDLANLNHWNYYTGFNFTILAEGPGQPVAEGGRYDNMMARFGLDVPATGFAFDADSLIWALGVQESGVAVPHQRRLVIGSRLKNARIRRLVDALRADGAIVSVLDHGQIEHLIHYARAWNYDAVLLEKGAGLVAYPTQTQRAMLAYMSSDVADVFTWLATVG